jgi:Protein of unknown function (DUF541)
MAISGHSWTRSQIGRHVWLVGVVALLVAACASAAGAGAPQVAPPAASSADASPSSGAGTLAPVGGPVAAPGSGGSGVAVSGGGASGPAIAYPYPGYPGTPGLAPDHTIVVTGSGQAPLAPDQTNRVAMQQVALRAALADAKAQADLVASATGVAIQGILSVSVSTSQGYFGPVPMVMGAPGGGATGPGVPTPAQPQIAPVPEIDVTVTVAYRIGWQRGLSPGAWQFRHAVAATVLEAGERVEAVSSFPAHYAPAGTTIYLRRLEGVEDRAWAEVAAAIAVWGEDWPSGIITWPWAWPS